MAFVRRLSNNARSLDMVGAAGLAECLVERRLAERVGFEPTCRLPDKTLSRRPRYDHFGTSPVTRGSAEQVIITGAFP